MKELAKEYLGEFNCLEENTEKYKTFLVPITKKVKRIDKNGKQITENIFYKLQFIYCARILSILLNLVDNLDEGIHKINCLSANPTKLSHTLKQFGSLLMNCLSGFDHFVRLALKGLNANVDIMIKNVKRAELNTKIVSAVFNTQTLKMI